MRVKGKTISVILVLLAALLTTTYVHAKNTILEFYNSIPLRMLNNQRYQLQFVNGKWMIRNHTAQQSEAIVDVENGYINITDEGTGGGSLIQELAQYRTAAGIDIIGVNLIEHDGIGPVCALKFYKPDDQWRDITKDLLPEIDLFIFMDGHYRLQEHKMPWFREFTRGIKLIYDLPRTGTTLKVGIDLDRFILEHKKNDGSLISAAYEIITHIQYREIKLLWDRKNNRFDADEKTLFSPSSDPEKQYIHKPGKETKQPYAVQANDPERKPILDALRKHRPGADVVFVVHYLKISKGWAWIHVSPRARDGKSQWEDESWLMQKQNGRWAAVQDRGSGMDCEEDPDCSDDARFFKKLQSKYPSAPADIFPY